jgi:alpha,alpha-trehalose phosphorylase
VPEAAAEALKWRLATLPKARERARELCLEGAAFPWRTISGAETGAYWPAGTAAFHINADIAQAVCRHCDLNVDPDFERDVGLPLLVETARLWRSLGHHDAHGAFRIDGVTGPDEYSAVADNNVYTNLLAQKNLRAAAEFSERYVEGAEALEVDNEEIASWRDAAEAMTIPYDAELGVHPQAERFTDHARWDFANTDADDYPLLLHFPYFDLYRKQVVKQADLVMAMLVRGESFTAAEKARNFAYYEPLTVRDSSLSACVQAVLAAETGHLELAYDYLGEAALMDLDDLEHNSRDGLHIASLAGTWIAAVCGFGGLRDHDGLLSFAPRLPERLDRLAFRLEFRGRRLLVEVTGSGTKYSLLDGDPLRFQHFDDDVELTADGLEFGPGPAPEPPAEPVHQPPGRAPLKRRPSR